MASVDAAVLALVAGGLAVFPTESVYGLGADATSAAAVERLVSVRGREPGKPILVLASDVDMVTTLVRELTPRVRRAAERLWPGAVTLVLPARDGLPAPLTAGTGTIGVRVPSHETARALPKRLGHPVTAPSANPPGSPPAETVAAARRYFGDAVGAYVDGGRRAGTPSTVVIVEDDDVRVVRAGRVDEATIRRAMEE